MIKAYPKRSTRTRGTNLPVPRVRVDLPVMSAPTNSRVVVEVSGIVDDVINES